MKLQSKTRRIISVILFSAIAFTSCSSVKTIWIVKKRQHIESSKQFLYPLGIHSPRYVAYAGGSSSYAQINNKAADLILDGKFPQAEILLSDLVKEYTDRPEAFNNLGIAYETADKKDKAFENYQKACSGDPDNTYYRINFNNVGALQDE